jgi:arylsulfatase A-like enzyme
MTLSSLSRRPVARLLSVAALGCCAACGDGERSDGSLPPIKALGGITSLLAMSDALTVEVQREDYPVVQNLIKPRPSGQDDHGLYPAIEVSPPCELRYSVPATHPRAELQYATCVMQPSYKGVGRVVVELELEGELVAEHVLSSSADVAAEDRRWYRASLPIGEGGELLVRTRYEGDQETAPRVGLGLLQISVPYEVERRPAQPDQPNIVVVLVDTLRADRLSSYGYEEISTPHIDALAARGLRYEYGYSSSAWTMPSTASVLTGMSPPEHGVGFSGSYYLADSVTTLAESFQEEGFTTCGIATNPLIAPSRNFNQGFEYFETHNWAPSYKVYQSVADWVRANAGKQFFLYVHYTDPHFPYVPTPEALAKVDAVQPENLVTPNVTITLPAWYANPDETSEAILETNAYLSKMYDAQVIDVDQAVGHLVSTLEELGILDNTIIVLTSDHGEEFLEHGWSGHHAQLYDESVRIPLILAGPGIPQGETRDVRVENRWLGGTLLRAAGLGVPPSFEGPDLISEEGEQEAGDSPVFQTNSKGWWADLETKTAYKLGAQHAMLYRGWRLIWRPSVEGHEAIDSLFDLTQDPGSLVDIANEHPDKVLKMRDLIRTWIREGREKSMELVPAMAATKELLEGIGYIEGGD